MKMENKDYKKLYEDALERAKFLKENTDGVGAKDVSRCFEEIFPELKDSEDGIIRKELIEFVDINTLSTDERHDKWIAWLEKQGTPAKLSEEERNRFAKGVLSECAMSFINYLDSNKREGKMCVSNGECEDIENAFHNAMWDRLHGYHCKYIDKQGEQKPNPYSGTSFEYNGHTWGMCARDYGVEILIDSNLKAFVSLDKTETYPLIPNKITPKFKAGDWVINEHGFVMQIVDVQDGWYVYMYEGKGLSATIKQMENSCHLWTIQDAKDGDILVASDNSIFLFKCVDDYSCKHYVALTTDNVVQFNEGLEHYWETSRGVHPATHEQRDFLFSKMKESGYEWDTEKKELRKIEKSDSTWSDEDEERYLSCLQRLRTSNLEQPETINTIWLKSLKDQITLTKNDNDLKKL